MSAIRIAPSLLSADFARLGEEITAVLKAGADCIHLDVMDNHYVPNLTVGPMVCQAIRPYSQVPIDVHLMISPVDKMIKQFAKAGANIITVHPEATNHIDRTIQLIHEVGCQAGLAFNPATPLVYLDHLLDKLDVVLIMLVNPGFGGQQLISSLIDKIAQAKARIDLYTAKQMRPIWLEVDGGITCENIATIAKAGADTFVAGSAIFCEKDYGFALQKMRQALLKNSSSSELKDSSK